MSERIEAATQPLLSVIAVIVSDTTASRPDSFHLSGLLDALDHQSDPPSLEILVPYHPPVLGIEEVKHRFPHVVFMPVEKLTNPVRQGGSREHHDKLRARGLAAAHGEILGLLEDHALPDPNWCARVVAVHQQRFANYGAVGGAIENGIDRTLNWAVYFCDFAKYQNPVVEGESDYASDANIAYKKSVLQRILSVWQDSFHETTVNDALLAQGQKLALSPQVVIYQHRSNLRFGNALRERFVWGRSYAATRTQLSNKAKRLIYVVLSPILPFVLVSRMTLIVFKKGRHVAAFLKALPLIILLSFCWSWGELVGYLTARTNSFELPADEVVTVRHPADS